MSACKTSILIISLLAGMLDIAPASAQFYPGSGYGGPGLMGPGLGGPGNFAPSYYPGGNNRGGYSFNNWYVSPYRTVSPGYTSPYGGFGPTVNYGSLGFATGYGLPANSAAIVAPPSPLAVPAFQPAMNAPTGLSAQFTQVPSSPLPPSGSSGGLIKLASPKSTLGSLTYLLNGQQYTITPGYSQSFPNDRVWVLKFNRRGEGSESVQYTLKDGNYKFAMGQSGWELHQMIPTSAAQLPPAPLPAPGGPQASPGPTPSPPP